MTIKEKLSFKVEGASAPHERDIEKPNEDRLFIDEERGIFILLDGVTRPHSEYVSHPYESAALDLGNIFIEEAYRFILDHISDSEPESILRGAVMKANLKIREYRNKFSCEEWEYYPSTLGFVVLLRDGVLHYVSVGDSIAVLVRRNAKMLFGREWALEAVDKLNLTKKERYEKYCNHPENHLSYTVFNGDDEVMRGLEYSFIDIHKGDVLFIASDGIGDYLKYEKSSDIIKMTPCEIIDRSGEYDRPPYAEYADDKTVIKLSF